MKVSAREIERSQVVLEVEVEPDRVERALDQAYRRIVNRIKVPGFRPGKAPRPIVERMIGREALLEEAIERLVPDVYDEAVREQQLEPIGRPRLEVTSTSPLQFRATVPLRPKVDLGDYTSIRIEPLPTEPTPEEIEQALDELREGHAEWLPVERPVQVGDRVSIDVRATAGERVLLDSHDAEFVVDPQGPQPAPGFADQLVGLAAGETRTFTLTWPEEARDRTLAGQPVAYEVKVNWVKEKSVPPADDEFAVRLGEFQTIDQVRQELAGLIRSRKERAEAERREQEAIRAVVAQAQLEIAPPLVEEEADHLRERLAQSLDRQGITMEQYIRFRQQTEAEFRQELLAEAEEHVRRSLVLDAVARSEGLTVSESEVEEEIQRLAAEVPEEDRRRQAALARPETRARVEAVLRERKAVRRLLELTAPVATTEGVSQV